MSITEYMLVKYVSCLTHTIFFYWVCLNNYHNCKIDKTGNVHVTLHWDAFMQPMLQKKSNEYYTTWVCVFVALGIWHVMCMHHLVICGHGMILEKKLLNTKCVLIFSTTFVQNISHSKKKWVTSKTYTGLHVKYTLFLSSFGETWIFLTDIWKIH